MTINDIHEALTELCEAMKGKKTLREQLNHIDVYFDANESDANELLKIAKQMDALLEECFSHLNSGWQGNTTLLKLKQAGCGQ